HWDVGRPSHRMHLSFSGRGSFRMFRLLVALLAFVTFSNVTCAQSSTTSSNATTQVPAWVLPLTPPAARSAARSDAAKPVHLPNSTAAFTRAELSNRFSAPDWYPGSHGPMPEVVARGRASDLYACGYCHTPGGQGRPENAALAGLP